MKVLKDRGSEYGLSWYLDGRLRVALAQFEEDHYTLPVRNSIYQSNWQDIISKICRIGFCPEHLDSWKDIQGYAKLSESHIMYKTYHGEVPKRELVGTERMIDWDQLSLSQFADIMGVDVETCIGVMSNFVKHEVSNEIVVPV